MGFPGVPIEEFTPVIAGVGTGAALFVGPTEKGPLPGRSNYLLPVTSLAAFRARYGASPELFGGTATVPNDLALAAQLFFANGGERLFVARVRARGIAPGVRAYRTALKATIEVDETLVIAAPGSSRGSHATAIQALLASHVAASPTPHMALLDPPPSLDVAAVRAWRSHFAERRAALYYPWLVVQHPVSGADVVVPPSGAVAGVIAATDRTQGPEKAPTGSVSGVLRAERDVTNAEQQLLNPEGINALRTLPGRGVSVWGARTTSNDPEWRYVSIVRYLGWLQQSIAVWLRQLVFEPNTPATWARVVSSCGAFLQGEWTRGALMGTTPRDAWFVRCDQSTMSQDDIDNGRLICLVGVAPLRPAEFIIFRIGVSLAATA